MATLGSSFWADVKQFLSMGVPFDEGLQAASANLRDSGAKEQVDKLLQRLQSGELKGDWLAALDGVIPQTVLAGLSGGSSDPKTVVDGLLAGLMGDPGEGLGQRLLDPLKWLSRNVAQERESLLNEVNSWLAKDGVAPDIPSRDDRVRALIERLEQAGATRCELAIGDNCELVYGGQREEWSAVRGRELLAGLRAAGRPQALGPGERWSLTVEVGGETRRCELVSCRFGKTTRVRLELRGADPVYPWHETLGSAERKACEQLLRRPNGVMLAVSEEAGQVVRGLCALAAGNGRRTVSLARSAGDDLGKAWPLAWAGRWDDPELAELVRAHAVEVLGVDLAGALGAALGLAREHAGGLLLLGVSAAREAGLRAELARGGWSALGTVRVTGEETVVEEGT